MKTKKNMSEKRSRRASVNETPEDIDFQLLTDIAVEAIKKHPVTSFDEPIAHWFGDDVHQKYTVIATTSFRLFCGNRINQ